MSHNNNNALNENFDISKLIGGDANEDNNEKSLGLSRKAINVKKKSILDDIPDQESQQAQVSGEPQQTTTAQIVVTPEPIVVPKSVQEIAFDNSVREDKISKKAMELKKRLELKKKKSEEVTQTVVAPEVNQQLIEDYQEQTGKIISTEDAVPNIVEIKNEVEEAMQEIPDLSVDSLSDIDITPLPDRKDKTGYIKSKVTIKSLVAGEELSKIATIAKNESRGEVRHRPADLRLIANTNKTQLRGSELLLLKTTYTFKPVGGTVNKSTRVMVSVPEDFNTNKNVIVFIQRSRDKFIAEVELYDGEDVEWLGKFIGNFFFMEFVLAERKLKFKGVNDPLVPVMINVARTNDFLVSPVTDRNSNVTKAFKIITKGTENQWLGVVIREAMKGGTYYINVISKVDKDWRHNIELKSGTPITVKYLMSDEFIQRIYSLYKEDWTKFGVNFEDENRELFLINKLTHTYLKKAFMQIYDLETSNPELGIKIGNTLSKNDTKAAVNKDYDAEAIIGKTKYLDYFILSYHAVQIIGGDKRNGKTILGDKEYNEKYKVADDRAYQQRKRTVLKKEGANRNYNSRVYMFQLEYSVEGQLFNSRANTFDELNANTAFLTKSPKEI